MSKTVFRLLSLVCLTACAGERGGDGDWRGQDTWSGSGDWSEFDTGYGRAPSMSSETWRYGYRLDLPANGAAFLGNEHLIMGVRDVVCTFDQRGDMRLDRDLVPETVEHVVEADEDVVVVVDFETEQVGLSGLEDTLNVVRYVPGIVDGRHDGAGDLIALVDDPEHGCAVAFHEDHVRTLVRVPVETCPSATGFDVDKAALRAFVGGGDEVFVVQPDGAVSTGERGDTLAWDPVLEQLYIGVAGEPAVSALELDKGVVWRTELPHELRQLRALGQRGAAAARLSTPRGAEIWTLDGLTGEASLSLASEAPLQGLTVSARGFDVAVWSHDMLVVLGQPASDAP